MDLSKLKIKKQLLEMEKHCYAMDHIKLPENGIDCSEGCNPYGFPAECANVMKNLDTSLMGPYPHSEVLYDAIAKYWVEQIDLKKDNIMLSDGSVSALYIIDSIFDTHDTVMLGIAPQFTDYYMHTEMLGIKYETYKLKKDNNYKFNLSDFLAMDCINDKTEKLSGSKNLCNYIYIDNPNNPTGQSISIKDIEEIVKLAFNKNIIVIIDEAYGEFMPKSESAINLIRSYPNLIVVRTLSKGFGLAGLRVGYVIADSNLIKCINKMVNPYMVSGLSRVVAAEALKHEEFIEACKKDFAKMKTEIKNILSVDSKLHMSESLDTNSIVMLYHDNKDINLKEEFYKLGVLVIDGNDFEALDSSAARIRLPKINEFPILLNAINAIKNII